MGNIIHNDSGRKLRDSNIELFRIVTMIMIVAHHYVVNSGLNYDDGPLLNTPMTFHSLFLLVLGAWGKIGINSFVLITGYYMCTSSISIKKYIKLLSEIIFYNIVIYIIFVITNIVQFSLKDFLLTFIPISKVTDNFTGCFLIFFLLIPFINILISNMNKKQHGKLIVVLFVMYVFFGTIKRVSLNYVSWFVVVYIISSYVRLYPNKVFESVKISFVCLSVCVVLSIASVIVCTWRYAFHNTGYSYMFVTDSNTLLAIATAFFAFLFFKNLHIKPSRCINIIGASTFGVLLIHDNSDAMRQWLWCDLLNNINVYNYDWGYIHAIGSVVGVYVICTIIDIIRIKIVEVPFIKVVNKFLSKCCN